MPALIKLTTTDDELLQTAAALSLEWNVDVKLVIHMLEMERVLLKLHHRLVIVER